MLLLLLEYLSELESVLQSAAVVVAVAVVAVMTAVVAVQRLMFPDLLLQILHKLVL